MSGEYRARERRRPGWERTSVLENNLRELLGWVILSGFEPMDGDAEFRRDLPQCLDARLSRACFNPADIRETDAFGREVALRHSERCATLADPVTNGRHDVTLLRSVAVSWQNSWDVTHGRCCV